MAAITGTNGNDNLGGTADADTISPLLGQDSVDGLGGIDILVVDYSSAPVDPYWAQMGRRSAVTSSGNSFGGTIRTVDWSSTITFSNIEALQVTLGSVNDYFAIDAAALLAGATFILDGKAGNDTLEANFSAFADDLDLALASGGGAIGSSSFANFEIFRLKLGSGSDTVAGGALADMLAGGGGSDTLDGGGGEDVLYSAQESPAFNPPYIGFPYVAPLLDIGSEVDTLSGGGGADRIFAGYGDNADGGAHDYSGDVLYISFLGAPAGVVADFRQEVVVIGGGEIRNFEGVAWVQGSHFDDYVNMAVYAQSSYSNSPTVFGMGGNDHLVAGYHTAYMDGGEGNDIVDGRPSIYAALIAGGAGDDILYTNAAHSAVADGGDGNDTIYSNGRTFGGAGDDTIVMQWTYYALPVFGDSGDDDITAADSGNDLSGGAGADTLRGAAGNDVLSAGDFLPYSNTPVFDMALDRDRLTGGAGADKLSIGFGDDADGGSGDDILWLSLGGLAAGATLDTAGIVSGQPFILGGGTIANIEVLASLRGSDFNDVLTLATQATSLTVDAGDGDDVITSNASTVILSGGGGGDRLNSGSAADTFDGGAGSDTISYGNAAAGINLTLAPDGLTTNGPGGDQLVNVENIEGSSHSDSLTGNAIGNVLSGGGGDDTLTGFAGNDTLDGGTGADTLIGGAHNDIYIVDNTGDVVTENPGEGTDEIRTSLAAYSLVALPHVEKLTATPGALARDLRGNSGNNVITGGEGSDILRIYDGGNDTVLGGAGSDNIFFIGALTAADVVRGGTETDTLVLQGAYGTLALTANITEIENISFLGGGNTTFGEPGTNRHDYVLIVHDANFAAGVQARINGAALLEGEDFTFDGSAETDAKFVVYGGKGKDTLTGGLGHDIFFYAEERFATGDTVNGGPGYDGMFLRGNYTIDFNAPGYTGLFTNIENLTLTSATDERYARGGGTEFDYNLTLSNAIVKPGETLTVSGTILLTTETMILDASQELDGFLRLFGGRSDDTLKGGANADLIHGNLGADSLTGNGGADLFRFDSAAESDGLNMDRILDFTPGTDRIDLGRIDANSGVAGDQAFSWLGSNAFSGTAGELRAYESSGSWMVEGDVDGDGAADLVLELTLQGPAPLGAGDFLP